MAAAHAHEGSATSTASVFGQERENESRDLVVLLIQSEMASVEQMDFGVRQIALESLCPRSNRRDALAPPNQGDGAESC